ncbi:MAG: hypothetical protein QHC40_04950 [Sphingobium sp.]|nr:hypothetical protein [Sphingobium sp.]
MKPIDWDQPATLIDLAGKAPLLASIGTCVQHFGALKAQHQAEARILLTAPVAREGQKTRTWLLDPPEIAALLLRWRQERA